MPLNDLTQAAFNTLISKESVDSKKNNLENLLSVSTQLNKKFHELRIDVHAKAPKSLDSHSEKNLLMLAASQEKPILENLFQYAIHTKQLNFPNGVNGVTSYTDAVYEAVINQKIDNFIFLLNYYFFAAHNEPMTRQIYHMEYSNSDGLCGLAMMLLRDEDPKFMPYLKLLLIHLGKRLEPKITVSEKEIELINYFETKSKTFAYKSLMTCYFYLHAAEHAYMKRENATLVRSFSAAVEIDADFVKDYLNTMIQRAVTQSLAKNDVMFKDEHKDYRFVLPFIRVYAFILQASVTQYDKFKENMVERLKEYNTTFAQKQIALFTTEKMKKDFLEKPLVKSLMENASNEKNLDIPKEERPSITVQLIINAQQKEGLLKKENTATLMKDELKIELEPK